MIQMLIVILFLALQAQSGNIEPKPELIIATRNPVVCLGDDLEVLEAIRNTTSAPIQIAPDGIRAHTISAEPTEKFESRMRDLIGDSPFLEYRPPLVLIAAGASFEKETRIQVYGDFYEADSFYTLQQRYMPQAPRRDNEYWESIESNPLIFKVVDCKPDNGASN